jgi:hypothetical protein
MINTNATFTSDTFAALKATGWKMKEHSAARQDKASGLWLIVYADGRWSVKTFYKILVSGQTTQSTAAQAASEALATLGCPG